MLVVFLSTGAVQLSVGSITFAPPAFGQPLSPWLLTLIAGFAAGFLERLLPDLLQTVHPTSSEPPQTPPRPPADGHKNAAGAVPDPVPPGPGVPPADAPPPEVPESERDSDGCEVEMDETAAPPTADERLPPASGGVA